jgi:energy-coupling factor transporter ATP-binding protein EcfA2
MTTSVVIDDSGLMHVKIDGGLGGMPEGFEWKDIPPLAVLTGDNGAGKSRLLGVLQKASFESSGDPTARAISIGLMIRSPANLQKLNDVATVVGRDETGAGDIRSARVGAPLEIFLQRESELAREYLVRKADDLLQGREHSEAPPWERFNSVLADLDVPLVLRPPHGASVGGRWTLELRRSDGEPGSVGDLSEGEKKLLAAVLWAKDAPEQRGRLLLLDEFDAHFHTSRVAWLMRYLRETLVERLGIRVVLVTHRPDAIALAPEDGVFHMDRASGRIERVDRAEAVVRISGGIFAAAPPARCVVVEDSVDGEFFRQMLKLRPSTVRNLQFVPVAMREKGKSKTPGGRESVRKRVAEFAAVAPLVQGIIDRDEGNAASDHVHVLARYAIENYWADPIHVYVAVLRGKNGQIDKLKHSINVDADLGQEARIREKPQAELQSIANAVLAVLEVAVNEQAPIREDEKVLEDVTFLRPEPIVLRYPRWFLHRQGRQIKGRVAVALGVDEEELRAAMSLLRLLPSDVENIFKSIEN